ncbi:DUF429 domain-containing protein [Actinomadura sp. BRA 177]|nr:DUF429 domain-containing protein [Actinomadura sp. BRA 177]
MDACAGGWVGIALSNGPAVAYFAHHIETLVTAADQAGKVDVIAIDMPIGLPDDGVREADECARKELGPRRSTVFITPVRRAFEGATHAEANEINREITGKGISAQAFALKGKVLEVDEWVRRSRSRRIVEVHPELSFAELGDGPLDTTKASWAGMEKRRGLLAGAGIVLEGDLGTAGRKARVDDVLDAAAAAWTARRVALGEARCLPAEPYASSDGVPCAIWA